MRKIFVVGTTDKKFRSIVSKKIGTKGEIAYLASSTRKETAQKMKGAHAVIFRNAKTADIEDIILYLDEETKMNALFFEIETDTIGFKKCTKRKYFSRDDHFWSFFEKEVV